MQKLTIRLVKEGVTARYVKYSELDGHLVGIVYISKESLPKDNPPDRLNFTVSEVKE